jgi:MFS family permease
VLLVTLTAFEAVAVATAMPVTARELGAVSAYAWAFTGFLAAFLVGTVLSGEACDTDGPRRPMIAGLAAFVAGLLIAGLAPTMLVLVVGRAFQGIGAGAILVAMYVVVARAYPESVRPKVFAAMAAAWVLPAMVGPLIAGLFADHLSWRLVFLTVPLLVVPAGWAIWPTLRVVDGPPPEPVPQGGRKRAAVATAVGVAALQQAGVVGGVWAAALLVVAVVLLVPSVPRLLPAGTLRLARGLPTAVAMRGLLAGPFAVVDVFIPLMLVSERGLSTTAAGFALIGGTFGWAWGSWMQGRRAAGVGEGRVRLVQGGAVLLTVGIGIVCTGIYLPMPGWIVGLGWGVSGIGMGLSLASINVIALELSAPADQGATAAAIQVSDGLAAVTLTCVAGALFATFHRAPGLDSPVFLAIFLVPLFVASGATLVAPRLRVSGSRVHGGV